MTRFLTLVGIAHFLLVQPSPGQERRCTDARGAVLYIVSDSGRVTDAAGKLLGEVRPNGDVYDDRGRLMAHHRDAGLLISVKPTP